MKKNSKGNFKMQIAGFLLMILLSCNKNSGPTAPQNPCVVNGVDTCLANTTLTATVMANEEIQTIHSFGASDCWGIKFIGKNWPIDKRNQIADLLFSRQFDQNGNPKGIGLSMWRINVGAGSYEQGEGSHIGSDWRREECFLDSTGAFDWSKQAGNRWFAEAAKQRGVENLLLFAISPPVSMTKNGFAFAMDGAELGKFNLRADKYGNYADFLTEVAKSYQQSGLSINYISPLNEPQWNWNAGSNGIASQEGTGASNGEAFEIVKQLDGSINAKNLNARIAFGEVGAHNFAYGVVSNNSQRSDVMNFFWNPSSSGYLGNFQHVEKILSSHSYFSQPDVSSLINNRTALASRMSGVNSNVKFWQSEYCILSGEDNTAGNGRDLGINSALYIARVIHTDLAIGNATSWQWWLGVSPSDYKDGLVYVSDLNGNMGELSSTRTDGLVYPSKMLWALGNFSRFVRPGMVRIKASLENNIDPAVAAGNLMISAYKNNISKEVVIVVINMSSADQEIKLSGLNFSGSLLKTYTTSATEDLKFSEIPSGSKFTISGKSIKTLVGVYQ